MICTLRALPLLLVVSGCCAFPDLRACTTPRNDAIAPPRGALIEERSTPESAVLIPIEISLAAIRDSIDADLPDELARQEGTELDNGAMMDLLVTRAGEVAVSEESGSLHIQLPIAVNATITAKPKVSLGIIDRSRKATASGALTLHVRLLPKLGDNWDLESDPQISISWDTEPTAQIGPFKFKITKKVHTAIEKQYPDIITRVQDRLRDRADSKAKVAQAWQRMTEPTPLGDNDDLWLSIQPNSLHASDLVVEPDKFTLQVGLAGRFRVESGPRPPNLTAGPVPPRTSPPNSPGFHLYVPVALDYPSITAALSSKLNDQVFEVPAPGLDTPVAVRLSEPEVYPSGRRLVVGVTFAADAPGEALDTTGVLYLVGDPEVDRQHRTIKLANADFDAHTDSMLMGVADWLLHDRVKDAVADRLVVPYGAQLDGKLTQMNAHLWELHPQPGLTMRARLDTAAISDVYLTDTSIVLDSALMGNASLRVDELQER